MANSALTPFKRLLGLLKIDTKDVLQTFYYAIFAGVVNLSLPLGIQAIINLIQGAEISTSWIILVVLVTLGVAFGGVLQLMQIRIIENLQQKIFIKASFELAYRFPKVKMSELSDYYPPELANRFFDTINIQKSLAKLLLDFPAALLQIIFGLLLLSFYHPFFIIYGLLLVVLIYIVFKFTAERGLETSLTESKYKYKVAHWIQEIARSLVSFKMSGRTNHALGKNDMLVNDYLKARESHFKVLVLQFIQMIGFKVLVTAGLLLIGGLLVLNQEMNIGQFVAAEIIILLVITSVEKLIKGLETIYDLLTGLEKLGQVVDKDIERQDGETPITSDKDMLVELDGISFAPKPNAPNIIDNLSFTIKPKTTTLIMGANGSGKTTLLRLIAGLYQPTQGNIYVNSISLNNIYPNNYRSFVGQSLTEESTFEGSILNNITFGDPNISQEEVYWAIDKVQLTEFVKKQPQGINTYIFPAGLKIPHNVAKKIVLARAIIKKPKLLILKEPLDQLDEIDALKIMNFLTDKSNPWAIVIVSHDVKWLTRCDRIITIDEGKIVSDK
ncbi:MAG: ATP-binding cassette domain-containing protein [Cellulophaga sp.]|nr:ATP-binding cassette domain-containing protein [Cellulophaga sp.]